VVLTGIVLYSALSLVIFYPAWWGVKYGMLLIPFAGLFGMYMFKESSWGLLAATVISLGGYLIYDTPLSPTERWGIRFRAQLAKAYFTGEWPDDVNLDMVELQPELGVTLWMNHNLPDGSTVMSFSIMKRYFSDHQWIAAWRYPRSRWLYSENDLEAEIALLLELGVDYIVITTADPAPGNEENDLQMLAHIGPGNLLEPIVEIDGQMVLKVNWQAI